MLNPTFYATLLDKRSAYQGLKDKGDIGLYKAAWEMHIKYAANTIIDDLTNELTIVVATLGTRTRAKAMRKAIHDTCEEKLSHLSINICIWDSSTSIGLQVADYGLWVIQRSISGKTDGLKLYEKYIRDHVKAIHYPFGEPELPTSALEETNQESDDENPRG